MQAESKLAVRTLLSLTFKLELYCFHAAVEKAGGAFAEATSCGESALEAAASQDTHMDFALSSQLSLKEQAESVTHPLFPYSSTEHSGLGNILLS